MLKNSSVSIAKNRLRTLVISDRVQCTPSAYEHICKDLYERKWVCDRSDGNFGVV